MSRDLILHIGMSKTGSTSIQRILSTQRPSLLAQGLFYPQSPGHERHEYLAAEASTNKHHKAPPARPLWQGMTPVARLARFREEFAAEMADIPANVHRLVVSAEQFSMFLLDRQSVQNLHDLLRPHVDSITVVVYLRRPDQHFTSLYTEMLRWGDARSPDLLTMPVLRAHDYDYHALLERWAGVFGDKALKPRIFEQPRSSRFDVVDDFLSICGATLEQELPAEARAANQSINHAGQLVLVEIAKLIREGNTKNVQSPFWSLVTLAASRGLPGRGWLPTREEARVFNERYTDSMEQVRQKWFPERKTLFSLEYGNLPEAAVTPSPEAVLDASARIVQQVANICQERENRLTERLRRLNQGTAPDVRLQTAARTRNRAQPVG